MEEIRSEFKNLRLWLSGSKLYKTKENPFNARHYVGWKQWHLITDASRHYMQERLWNKACHTEFCGRIQSLGEISDHRKQHQLPICAFGNFTCFEWFMILILIRPVFQIEWEPLTQQVYSCTSKSYGHRFSSEKIGLEHKSCGRAATGAPVFCIPVVTKKVDVLSIKGLCWFSTYKAFYLFFCFIIITCLIMDCSSMNVVNLL